MKALEKKYLLFGLKWALGLTILVYLIRSVDFSKVRWAIVTADVRFLLIGLVLTLVIRLFLAWQTQIAVTVLKVPLTVGRAFVINLTTAFYGLVLPGDLSTGAVRWYKLSNPTGQGAEVFAAIVFQRLVNTLYILLFGLAGLLIDFPFERGALLVSVFLLLSGAAVLFGFVFSSRFSHAVESLLGQPLKKVPTALRSKLEKVLTAAASYRHVPTRKVLSVFLLAAADTLTSIVLFSATAAALGLTVPLFALIWIRSLVLLIQLVPASISGLGLREGALVVLLPYYGVAPVDALCFSLIIFGYTLFFSALGGLVEAWESLRLPDRLRF